MSTEPSTAETASEFRSEQAAEPAHAPATEHDPAFSEVVASVLGRVEQAPTRGVGLDGRSHSARSGGAWLGEHAYRAELCAVLTMNTVLTTIRTPIIRARTQVQPRLAVPAEEPVAKGSGTPPPPPPPPPAEEIEDPDEEGMLRMSFLEHLEELRKRLILALAGLGIAFFASLTFSEQLVEHCPGTCRGRHYLRSGTKIPPWSSPRRWRASPSSG